MRRLWLSVCALFGLGVAVGVAEHHTADHAVVLPAKIGKEDIAGRIFERPTMIEESRDGNTTLDVTTLLSSDRNSRPACTGPAKCASRSTSRTAWMSSCISSTAASR